jgi:hypothetical protein
MAPQVPGLFYSYKLQSIITWWKMPQHFTSKKVLRWVEHGVKVEFKKGLPFAPKASAPKFVDPQDVDFAIQDLLYQDLAPGGDQFLSRSRFHTPPGKGKQRIVHALCSLNDATAKSQTTYEDLHMLKSVVRPQDWMLSLDVVESAFFHVPIHPKHRKFFSSHLALPLFVKNKFIELQPELDIPTPPGVKWTGHSLRRGGASVAHAIGVSIAVIMAWGLWKSLATSYTTCRELVDRPERRFRCVARVR